MMLPAAFFREPAAAALRAYKIQSQEAYFHFLLCRHLFIYILPARL